MKAKLILENGVSFSGSMFGEIKNVVGEIVFTTGMTGYQEELTDPSFCGQIVTMTFPLVGNYGINLEDMEAKDTALTALVVREKCDYPNNFRCELKLEDFLKQHGVVGIEGIDTRALTRILRNHGVMKAVIVTEGTGEDEIQRLFDSLDNSDVVSRVAARERYVINENGKTKVAFLDLGTKDGILRSLVKRDCCVTVFPYDTPAEEMMAQEPDLVFVSNGPGNPMDIANVIETVKALLGKVPVFGICMGHLVISLALGAKAQKMKFGHHGGNHPVKDIDSGKVYITSQNHNYMVTDLPGHVEEMFVNVNDGSCEGIRSRELRAASVQFHPEACPGPLDTGFLFDRFLKEVR